MLPSLGLLWNADVNPLNKDSAAFRAMTGSEGESAVSLSVTFGILLKRCGVIHSFLQAPE